MMSPAEYKTTIAVFQNGRKVKARGNLNGLKNFPLWAMPENSKTFLSVRKAEQAFIDLPALSEKTAHNPAGAGPVVRFHSPLPFYNFSQSRQLAFFISREQTGIARKDGS